MNANSNKPPFEFLGDLLKALGNIPANRVRLNPVPGTATLRDLVRLQRDEPRIFELVDGTLVAKAIGFSEAVVAARVASAINNYAIESDLGVVAGSKGLMRFSSNSARSPEVTFISWNQLPKRLLPRASYPRIHPDMAVEIFRKGNTRREMDRKRREFFNSGCQMVWMVYPNSRTVDAYTDIEQFRTFTESDTLDGGEVLPGFKLPVRSLFVNLAEPKAKPRKRR